MSIVDRINGLMADPPPEFGFEISEGGLAWSSAKGKGSSSEKSFPEVKASPGTARSPGHASPRGVSLGLPGVTMTLSPTALLLFLEPGAYTAVMTGQGSAGGVGLVES